MAKKLDTRKVETALNKAARAATSGPVVARSGRIHGGAAKRTVMASSLAQKNDAKRK
jgi:hypothetical protein